MSSIQGYQLYVLKVLGCIDNKNDDGHSNAAYSMQLVLVLPELMIEKLCPDHSHVKSLYIFDNNLDKKLDQTGIPLHCN